MNRIEQVKAKYPNFADAAMSIEDPTKTHKYLLWIAAQLSKGHSVPDIKGTIDFFHKYNSKFQEKDIYKYEDLKTLEDICKIMPEKSNRRIREDLKEYGSETIFENDIFKVIRVDTKAAMILYGANTKWCTVSKEATFYEDYVVEGNDFYITVFKGKSPLSSNKYAIVRNDLLSFEIFADNDTNMRFFKPQEREILHDAVAAVAADKPKDNMLRVIFKNKNSLSKIQGLNEWVAAQIPSTMKYVLEMVPKFEDLFLLKMGNDGQALMDFIISTGHHKLSKLSSEQLKTAAEFLESWNAESIGVQKIKKRSPKLKVQSFKDGPYSIEKNFCEYSDLGPYFSKSFLIRLRNSSNYTYRNIAALHLKDLEDLKPLLTDSSNTVINTMLGKLTKEQLLHLYKSTDVSNSAKAIIAKKFESVLSTDDILKALLRKSSNELFRIVIEKMVLDLAHSKDGMKFLFDKLSDEEKEKLVT